MKRGNIKKTIKAKINFYQKTNNILPVLKKKETPILHNQVNSKKTRKVMSQEYRDIVIKRYSKQDKAFAAGNPNFGTNVNPDNKNKKKVIDIPVILKDYGKYVKEEDVDYDVVICVTSFERYVKVRRILRQLHTQSTKYTFKFCLMNDGSSDLRYDSLKEEFPNIDYIKNQVNGGKKNYWKTVNRLWSEGAKYKTHCFLQIDDDFILCNNFIDVLLDEFFKKKYEDNCFMVFSYHMYGYDKKEPLSNWWYNGTSIAIDGGTLFDNRFMKLFNHRVDVGVKNIAPHTSTFLWDTIVEYIRKFGVRVYRTPKSLAWHDGNYDSKLNYVARMVKKSYTKNFIDGDNIYNPDIDLSHITFD